jgi:hypothetical protein
MAKRSKHNHKHWIPRESKDKFIASIDPVSSPEVIILHGRNRGIYMVHKDVEKEFISFYEWYLKYWVRETPLPFF